MLVTKALIDSQVFNMFKPIAEVRGTVSKDHTESICIFDFVCTRFLALAVLGIPKRVTVVISMS